jgi:hypothetical protein
MLANPAARTVRLAVEPTESRQVADLGAGIRLEYVIRPLGTDRCAASVFLVNRRDANGGAQPEDAFWVFQPVLEVEADGSSACFLARRLEDVGATEDPDLCSAELLYRMRPEFATGHGCAANWETDPEVPGRTRRIWTEIMPAYELARVAAREASEAELDMRMLGGDSEVGLDAATLRSALLPLAEDYAGWIDSLEGRIGELDAWLAETAREQLDACRAAQERIVEGIELLANDDGVRRAFCFANRAMALQRERSVISLARRRGEAPPSSIPARWRPFQLAFVLLNLPALADRRHPDRRVADLLWFPTGGGKTEAYLGLTAFTLAHRRIRDRVPGVSNEAGVTVLMRYTLRLLTIQQFQRAATLICACERLRLEEGEWGEKPFRIGLWVGESATPNSYGDAKEALVSCPWCGAGLTPADYRADDETQRILISCPAEACEFAADRSLGLPVHMVDDEIYRLVPSLVIATVDKFARMPWNGRVQALFGRVDRWCGRHGYLTCGESHPETHQATRAARAVRVEPADALEPPDLIVQDELHLISGPLGTLVGIYETAVDALSCLEVGGVGTPPKVIASTATTRRAAQQLSALFRRSLQIFPPSGLDATDSYFGTEVSLEEEPGRLYVGVHAPGKSVKTALVRVYAALLSKGQAERSVDAAVADPYQTLVGYFNSLRELGGAMRLVEDDVPARMRVLARRDRTVWPERMLFEREELTSRRWSDEIPAILARLERPFPAGRPEPELYPIDVLLASNMISVGVDIDRLGLMVVNGQPKTTAEYIQATSRVGRQAPGLVVTVYNWTRPRDISHYERFRSYHSMLYRFVEATGVTPYSSRARDRALPGVLTAMVRLGDGGLAAEQAAGAFDPAAASVQWAIDTIVDRARDVVDEATAEATRAEVRAKVDQWNAARQAGPLCYTRRGIGNSTDRRNLLGEAESAAEGIFRVPGSLREVESELHVYLVDAQGGAG